MVLRFKTESFRDDFTFANSQHAIRRFPFPFNEDRYLYSVNIEPHAKGPVGSVVEFPIDIDEHYVAEMRDRALVLKEDPLRCQALPHMMLAQWDLLELLMTAMANDYPEHFTLVRDGDRWQWTNRPLDIAQSFTFWRLRFQAEMPTARFLTHKCIINHQFTQFQKVSNTACFFKSWVNFIVLAYYNGIFPEIGTQSLYKAFCFCKAFFGTGHAAIFPHNVAKVAVIFVNRFCAFHCQKFIDAGYNVLFCFFESRVFAVNGFRAYLCKVIA